MTFNLSKRVRNGYRALVSQPIQIVRIVILFVCSIIVVLQVTECFTKLAHPPITTHSHFELNQTVFYPAVTFCRNPPYNEETMRYYNLSIHPKITNHWRSFDFGKTNLDTLFQNISYDAEETLIMYALNGFPENVRILSHLFLNYGQCHTLVPLTTTEGSGKNHGYSIMLNQEDTEPAYDGTPAGWHVFIHERTENFTEINLLTSGRGEYMFVRVFEDIEIKLTPQHFNRLPRHDNRCSLQPDYSYTECSEVCQWGKVTQRVGCTVPWMDEMPDVSNCNSYEQMRDMLVEFGQLTSVNATECACPDPCRMVIFSANVMSRSTFANDYPSAQMWIYYSSKMVIVLQEQHGYDLNQFVSDLGGSLGFLLGLSVLGVIEILEKISSKIMIKCNMRKKSTADLPNKLPDSSPVNTDQKDSVDQPAIPSPKY